MNKLIEIYKRMSEDSGLFQYYTSTGGAAGGCMFSFITTNYRAILTPTDKNRYGYGGFAQGFSVIEDMEGIERAEWYRINNAGQEKEKQHTVPMRKSVLFQVKGNAYHKTHRGDVFKKMLLDTSLSNNDKRLLCYLLILPSSFEETPNYIFERTKYVFETLAMQNISEETLMKSIEDIINWHTKTYRATKKDLFQFDYVYYDSFFENKADFLALWIESSRNDRTEFKNYISDRSNQPANNILSKKYENSGVYTQATLIENAWMLYVTKHILDAKNITSFDTFIESLLGAYERLFPLDTSGRLFPVNKNNIRKFIFDQSGNRSVFQIIYCELFNIPVPLKDVAKDLTPEEIEKYGIIDSTDESGYKQREIFTAALKKLAKQRSDFKCECENAEGCKYFTSKETGQNYLEIHHLIPREFANDYDVSIETLENYVALCPNCHRKIHSAVDEARKHLIRLLFLERKDELQNAGLMEIDLKKMFEYYKVEDKS